MQKPRLTRRIMITNMHLAHTYRLPSMDFVSAADTRYPWWTTRIFMGNALEVSPVYNLDSASQKLGLGGFIGYLCYLQLFACLFWTVLFFCRARAVASRGRGYGSK